MVGGGQEKPYDGKIEIELGGSAAAKVMETRHTCSGDSQNNNRDDNLE
jgi:hypothetical protein